MSNQDFNDKSSMTYSETESRPLIRDRLIPPTHSSAGTHTHFHNPKASPSPRPGESIMNSNDPATADLRAWAEEKQKHLPGQDGSFVLGQLSMGAGAVSGGPVFLPRRNDTLPPPDELLGLKGEAFRRGSEAEKARKSPRPSRLGSMFGGRNGEKEEHGAAELVGGEEGLDEANEEKKTSGKSVQEGEGVGQKKKGRLSGLFHRHEKDERGEQGPIS